MAQFKTAFRKALVIGQNAQMCKNWPPHRNRPTSPRLPTVKGGMSSAQYNLIHMALGRGMAYSN